MKEDNLRRIRIFALLPLLAAFLSACAGMGPGYEAPTVSVQSFRPVASESGSGLPSFEILLHVINPNLEPLELAGVSYTISLDGHQLIKGVGNELPTIDGYGEGSFTLTAGFNVIAGIQLFQSLMEKDSDSFEYSFDAKLDPGAYRRKIRVSDSGSVSLSGRQSL
jgi:LEA14-like dessication related protein